MMSVIADANLTAREPDEDQAEVSRCNIENIDHLAMRVFVVIFPIRTRPDWSYTKG
jgi:hypothetical protein